MNKLYLLLCAALIVVTSACEKDPNMNSRLVNPPVGGSGGGGGGGGGMGGGGVNPTGPIVGSVLSAFATSDEGFLINNYNEPSNLAVGTGTKPTLMFDATQGSPDPGSLKVTAPYTGSNQYVDIQRSYGTTMPQNWAGKTMHVRIKATEGTFTGGAQVYVITTEGFVFGGTFTNFAANANWQEFTVSVDNPMTKNAGYDPTKVVVFGVQLNSGSAGTTNMPVTFHIDSFSIDPPIAGTQDAGGGGTDAPTTTMDSGTGAAGDVTLPPLDATPG
jgi:hypothetical protein